MHWETKKFMWLTLLQWFGTKPTLSPVYASISEKTMAPHSSTLAWKIHGKRSLVGCSPWGRKESDTTERLYFHFSLSCTGEGNGNPLQCSCLENPMDGGAWWAAVSGVTQSLTQLKWLSMPSNKSQVNKWMKEGRPPVSFIIYLSFPLSLLPLVKCSAILH